MVLMLKESSSCGIVVYGFFATQKYAIIKFAFTFALSFQKMILVMRFTAQDARTMLSATVLRQTAEHLRLTT